jgi:hypothetical protein
MAESSLIGVGATTFRDRLELYIQLKRKMLLTCELSGLKVRYDATRPINHS